MFVTIAREKGVGSNLAKKICIASKSRLMLKSYPFTPSFYLHPSQGLRPTHYLETKASSSSGLSTLECVRLSPFCAGLEPAPALMCLSTYAFVIFSRVCECMFVCKFKYVTTSAVVWVGVCISV
jgi:hypothetical protein